MLSAIIVEDEVLAAERLRVLLEECNVVLLNVFHHAQPALDWLSIHEADIVFADIGLPEINGLEFVERIKRGAKRQPEIIFTTAYEEHALRALFIGGTQNRIPDYRRRAAIRIAQNAGFLGRAARGQSNPHPPQRHRVPTHLRLPYPLG